MRCVWGVEGGGIVQVNEGRKSRWKEDGDSVWGIPFRGCPPRRFWVNFSILRLSRKQQRISKTLESK